jgi:hypothetical protein
MNDIDEMLKRQMAAYHTAVAKTAARSAKLEAKLAAIREDQKDEQFIIDYRAMWKPHLDEMDARGYPTKRIRASLDSLTVRKLRNSRAKAATGD